MHQYTVDSLSVQNAMLNAVYECRGQFNSAECRVCSVSDTVRSVYQVLCRVSDYVKQCMNGLRPVSEGHTGKL